MLVDDEPARVAGDERVLISGGSRLNRQARAMPGEARDWQRIARFAIITRLEGLSHVT